MNMKIEAGNLGSTSSDGFADIWLAAERFVEARKK